jgi:predicted TIM-barrel fold metal-dependent hydrolase
VPKRILTLAALLTMLLSGPVSAQSKADPDLLAQINKIKAIDNHAHPLRYVASGEKADDEYDALPLEAIEASPLPARLSPTNPEFISAWKDIFSYSYTDMDQKHIDELLATKQKVLREQGQKFPSWALDQLNIETMFANRVAMGPGLATPRFRWVSFVDALMFPLSNETAKKSNPDYAGFYPGEEKLLKRYLGALNLKGLPLTLDEYTSKVVTATLERQKQNGAVAVKFEAAYLRLLDFAPPDATLARNVYARYIKGGEPSTTDYKALQDYLFHHIAREAGRLGLAVHIHMINGAGGYYRATGSNPLLLEPTFNDPTLRKTNFVIIHGGYPYTKETMSMFGKPNVYGDFSGQTFLLYPRALSEVLRNWLETYPDRILFGTDAFSFGPAVDWPEVAWLSNTTARQALALALTGMMEDGEITRERALELATMALRDNAVRLYKLDGK